MIDEDARYHIKLFLSKFLVFRLLAGFLLAYISFVFYKSSRYFLFIRFLGKFEKLFDAQPVPRLLQPIYNRGLINRRTLLDKKNNPIYEDFVKRKYHIKYKQPYLNISRENRVRLRYENEDKADREGALLILKPQDDSKGVIYVQYNQGVFELAANFELINLYKNYVVIVEPSSWGYSDLALELLIHGENALYVMAQDKIDFDVCKNLDKRVVPMRVGAGDWIDLDSIKDCMSQKAQNRRYFDVTMVASWRKLKNHKLFFQSLGAINEKLSVAVVGYPWGTRNSNSVKKEQLKYAPLTILSLFEQVPHNYVFDVLQDSKVVLMLSEREGANRGIYEALFSGCKVIILKNNRGVNKELVNKGLIYTSTDEELALSIKNSLNINSDKKVDIELLSNVSGFRYTWDVICNYLLEFSGVTLSEDPLIKSKPNLGYVCDEVKLSFDKEYVKLKSYLN